jgi:hypothetical protein
MAVSKQLIPIHRIAQSIVVLRGQKVMLSQDLAILYEVPVKALNQAVKRHKARFPGDFVFQVNTKEFENLKSQFVTSSWGGLRRALPYAFSEQGVAMLSSVRKNDPAWGAHASRVLVSASRRNDLSFGCRDGSNDLQSPRWRDALANERDARATQ